MTQQTGLCHGRPTADCAIAQPLKTGSIMHDQTRHGQTENLHPHPALSRRGAKGLDITETGHLQRSSSRDTVGRRMKKRRSKKERIRQKTDKRTYGCTELLQLFIKGTVSKGYTGHVFMTAPNPKGCSKGKKGWGWGSLLPGW